MTYNATTREHLAPQHTASGLMNMATSSDEHNFWHCRQYSLLPILQWHDGPWTQQRTDPGSCHMSTSSNILEYLYVNVGVHFTSPLWVSWTHLSWGRNYTSESDSKLSKSPCLSTCLYASISTIELSPLFTLAQCGTQQFSLHADIARYAWEVSPPWPQLLLPDCVHFSCCSARAWAMNSRAPTR